MIITYGNQKMNKLVFGRDPTPGIVNVTLKDDKVFLYKETGEIEVFDYSPWVLSPNKVKSTSERLRGDQYWKYITPTTCEKFHNLQKKFQRDLWLPRNIEECALLDLGMTYYKDMKVEDVSILSFDIETSGLKMDHTSEVYLISNTFRRGGTTTKKLFSIDDYSNQQEMIIDWTDWVRKTDPSIITGHNILSYDLPYLANISQLKLGRDGSEIEFSENVSKFRKDSSQRYDYNNARIAGREIIDTFFLSIKYDIAREFPSYGLKPIIRHLGLEKKDRTFIDAGKIRHYRKDPIMWAKVKAYAEDDSEDALKLFDLMVPAYFYLAQTVPMTLQQIINTATGSQINSFLVRSYLQDGYSIAQADRITQHLEGGISFGVPGLYKNMLKIDLKSAYPSQVLRFKLYDKHKDPNAHFYEMVKYFTLERFELKKQYKETKLQYFKDRESTAKVFINSAYGICSTNYLNYNSPPLAAKITFETREMIDMSLKWASGKDKHYWIKLFKEKTGQKDDYA